MKTTTTKRRGWVEIQERDLDWFAAIYDLQGVATIEQLHWLYPSTNHKVIYPQGQWRGGREGTANRLSKLTRKFGIKHGYLRRLGWLHRRGDEPAAYALDEKAAMALADKRDYDFKTLKKQVKNFDKYFGEDSKRFIGLAHRLDVNTFRVALLAALKKLDTADWHYEEARPYWVEKTTDTKDEMVVTVRLNNKLVNKYPDGLFILRPDTKFQHKLLGFYEADRGTEVHEIVNGKSMAYYNWRKSGVEKFESDQFRVFYQTASQRRLKKMLTTHVKQFNSGIFWFTAETITPENILEPIWIIANQKNYDPQRLPRDQAKHSLLEFTPPKA